MNKRSTDLTDFLWSQPCGQHVCGDFSVMRISNCCILSGSEYCKQWFELDSNEISKWLFFNAPMKARMLFKFFTKFHNFLSCCWQITNKIHKYYTFIIHMIRITILKINLIHLDTKLAIIKGNGILL